MKCRVLNNRHCEITQGYSDNHKAVDITGGGYTLDYVVAHSDGKVVFFQDGLGNMKGSTGNASYGNCVKIDHGNGYSTLYAHMKKGLLVKNGQEVKKGTRLGYMSDSGNAYGAHLHFEVRKDEVRINPTEYLDKDLYVKEEIKYLSNSNYKGVSIVDALKQIKVDSSYNYRSKLAKANGINNYRGTAEQNTKMLNLLKQGKLKSI